ncbi:antibiotic biosynthesis monooxygenase [Antrihabitans spumae]|uniref:Antibiotic biosynthesis monooxygenase n=1 Tax=Antrihabitans spumae TaxID=3373370 RepID=A0ABW7KJM4_9NOCA
MSQETVTIVTQTSVRPEAEEQFSRWQVETSSGISQLPGFIEQTVLPPSPPTQVDWVILQRFDSDAAARTWLNSPERAARIEGAAPMLVGRDDVHVVSDGAEGVESKGVLPAPISVVVSTRVRPGSETEYRAWERRIAAAQTKAAGFKGYRFEPPIPHVQEDFLAILRFDSEANLQKWLDSPVRHQLVDEATAFTEEFHTRVVRTGFDHWFRAETSAAGQPPPAWKQNMMVVLMLYPVVFLFGLWVQTPLLDRELGLPFAVALFIGNVASVTALNWLVPWINGRFDWWLQPKSSNRLRTNLIGVAIVLAGYAVLVVVFWQFF